MIHYIALRTNAQATEDPEKVRSALKLFLPPQAGPEIIHETATSGYYGNPIIRMDAKLTKKKDCQFVIDQIMQHLEAGDISRLAAELPRRVDDDCNLYIRFDKQKAFQGRLSITLGSDAIHIRIMIKAYPAKSNKAIQVIRELFNMEE